MAYVSQVAKNLKLRHCLDEFFLAAVCHTLRITAALHYRKLSEWRTCCTVPGYILGGWIGLHLFASLSFLQNYCGWILYLNWLSLWTRLHCV